MIIPFRWLRAQVQVNEGSCQAKSGKADLARRRIELRSVVPVQGEINGDALVLRLWRAADLCIPLRTSVARPDNKRLPQPVSQALQMIEKARRMPILAATIPAATFASQLGDMEALPAPLVRQGAARLCD